MSTQAAKAKLKAARPARSLKLGDSVMVISGGNKNKRPNKGKVGKLLRFVGKDKERVVVEGINLVTRHQKATQPGETSGKIQKEASIHISNVMFYVEAIKKPVRLKFVVKDGTKVRGYLHPETKEFTEIEGTKKTAKRSAKK